jgi:hypothetical protein
MKPILICCWGGEDLFESDEDEGMTLTARACYRAACEAVSLLRIGIKNTSISEPTQEDGWAYFNLPINVACTVVWLLVDEKEHFAFQFRPQRTGCLGVFFRRAGIKEHLFEKALKDIQAAVSSGKLLQNQNWISAEEFDEIY